MIKIRMEETMEEMSQESNEQEAASVTEMEIVAIIRNICGDSFVVVPMEHWEILIRTVGKHSEDLMTKLQDLKLIAVPISLVPKKEESRILLPNGMPAGDGRIIV